ncbi:MAG: archaeoflavoprotein AfpA [Candidatus Bathyarchaeia archaeon]
MVKRIAWGLTGAGYFLSETIEIMKGVANRTDIEITIFVSKAAVNVLKRYGLWEELEKVSSKILVEKDPNTPFIVGPIQRGKYDFLLIAPATANTVAKIVAGIADSLVTNSVSEAIKGGVTAHVLPSDQDRPSVLTTLPSGEKIELTMRKVDRENFRKLKLMEGIVVLEKPRDIVRALGGLSP